MVVLNASERMEFGYIEGPGYQHDQLPVKTLSTKSLPRLPGGFDPSGSLTTWVPVWHHPGHPWKDWGPEVRGSQ